MFSSVQVTKAIVLSIGVFAFQTAICQKNFLPGSVINATGDTLRGFIDYRNWEKNPDKIVFRETLTGADKYYTPLTCTRFLVSDEVYESATVDIEVSPEKLADLSWEATPLIERGAFFLQTLIHGHKSLLYLRDEKGKDQFYIRQGSNIELLVHKKYIRKSDGKRLVYENNNYLGKLRLYFQDCSTIQDRLQRVIYEKQSLKKLFDFYYSCTQSEVTFKKEVEKLSLETGVVVGASYTSLTFNGYFYDYLVEATFDPSVNFTGGMFLNVVLPRNLKKLSLHNELIVTSFLMKGRYEDYIDEDRYEVHTSMIGSTHLKMNNMVRFTFLLSNPSIYLNVGVSNGLALAEQNKRIRESKFYSAERTETLKVLNDTRKYEQGILFGLGTIYKKYSLEVRYERGNGMSEYSGLNSLTERCFILVGYRF